MKRIVLCADDYGQAPAINAGILALVARKRLSAVSCMVNTPYWNQAARELLPYQANLDIGLHFNLTEGAPLSAEYQAKYGDKFFGLSKTMLKAFLLQLDSRVIAAECLAQIDAFVAATGFLPHFIDGHQHVQHLPVVRRALLNVSVKKLLSIWQVCVVLSKCYWQRPLHITVLFLVVIPLRSPCVILPIFKDFCGILKIMV
jgi:predicted glycoside hydrolase/deacetylase ChbG (UPF0249 family)